MYHAAILKLVVALAVGIAAVAASNETSSGWGTSFSVQQFNKVMATEASTAFGLGILSVEEVSELWQHAIDAEWSVVKKREEYASSNGRRAAIGREQGTSPFLLCDVNYGRSGEESKLNIERTLRLSNLIALYNKQDMTCFAVEALASAMTLLPAGVLAVPFTADMKIPAGLSDMILTSQPMLSRIEAVFCAGEADSVQSTSELASTVLEETTTNQGRRLRLESFLGSVKTHSNHRENFWRRAIEAIDVDFCIEMDASMNLEVGPDMMILTLPVEFQVEDTSRRCLHALILDLALQPEVCFVGGYQRLETFNDQATGIVQSGTPGWQPFHEAGLDGSGQVVALSDTGIDVDNCYFFDADHPTPKTAAGAESGHVDTNCRKVIQYIAYVDASDVRKGHGTHVAGSIAGRKAADGLAETNGEADGAARGAKLAFFDIGDEEGRLSTPSYEILFSAAYKTAGARIHSASWGVPEQMDYTSLDRSADNFMAKNPDFLLVVAAGNSGKGNKMMSLSSPGGCKNGLTVGASQNPSPSTKGPDYLADFSSKGPTGDGRRKPDVVAPGMKINSARAEPGSSGECDGTNPSGIFSKSGTSMATPLVSGTAALVRQYFEQNWHNAAVVDQKNAFSPRASLVKAVLLNGAESLIAVDDGSNNGISLDPYDMSQGFGRVNLLLSLPLAGQNQIRALFVNAKSMRSGGSDTFEVTIDEDSGCSGFPLSATLVWTDPPVGSSCSGSCVLNDLDLSITRNGQSGTIFPNGLGGEDRINNAERVRIENPVNGVTYSIHVKGFDLIEAQDYSLAVTGCLFQESPNDGSNDMPEPTGVPTVEPTNYPTLSPIKPKEDTANENADCTETSTDQIKVNAQRTETCSWLSSNLGSHGYLCDFLDVGLMCPVTCNTCYLSEPFPPVTSVGPTQTEKPPLEGDTRWHGNLFDMQAQKNLIVTNFLVHLANTKDDNWVRVWTQKGTAEAADPNGWIEVCDSANVRGGGRRQSVTLPPGDCTPIEVSAGDYQAWYVTLVDGTDFIMKTDANLVRQNDDLTIRSGYAVKYFDSLRLDGYAFDGGLQYSVQTQVEGLCTDQPAADTVYIHTTVGERSCDWLNRNQARFGFVCDLALQANYCPVTCNVCDLVGGP